ncbi:MAG TPA: ABC transporter permease [Anaerolineaceae bacterium]
MSIGQTILEALESLTANKMRSGLTVLGIVIGVAAVIAMLAIGSGAQASINGQIQGIGTNLVFIIPGNGQANIRNPKPLTLADANAMTDPLNAPDVLAVSPVVQSNSTVAVGANSERVSVSGVTPEYASVSNESVTEGEFITLAQQQGRSAVALIGPDTANKLFGRTVNLLGEDIRINGQPYRITGVLTSKGGSSFVNQDDRVLIPISTMQSRLVSLRGRDQVDLIEAQATSATSVNNAVNEITEILRLRHRLDIGAEDFTIRTQQQILSTASTITGVLTLFLGGIAAISLLVGGIGIMNIMLVSVTERTREIGLRKALGARRRDILVQFLTESILLSLVGGIFGIILAWIISSIVGALAAQSGTPITPQISINSILLATLFSMAVGLLFGLYPANRAATLQPVEALRYE